MSEQYHNEVWRDVIGYEGIYSVSDYGRVRREKAEKSTYPGKILSQVWRGKYKAVSLSNGDRIQKNVHVVVMEAFVGPRLSGFQVNHKDGDKNNNRLDNLEYCTQSENMLHSRRVLKQNIGTKHKLAKIIDSDVREIKRLYAVGSGSQRQIALMFNVSQKTVFNILKNRIWTHVV